MGLLVSLQVRKASHTPPEQSPAAEPTALGFGEHCRCSKRAPPVSFPPWHKISPKPFFLLFLSETKDGAVNMLQKQMTVTGASDTRQAASSPATGLGARGVWVGSACKNNSASFFGKGRLSKSGDS